MKSKNCADGSIFSHEEKYPARTLKIHPLQQESFLRQRREKTLLPEGSFAGLKQNFAGILIKNLLCWRKRRNASGFFRDSYFYFCTEKRALRVYVTYRVESSVCNVQSKVRVL